MYVSPGIFFILTGAYIDKLNKMGFLLALRFLTIWPFFTVRTVDNRMMAHSMAYFSFVGMFIGGAAAGANALLDRIFSPGMANIGSIVFMIGITGNLHGDGLMDAADGIFSGRSQDRMLEIMRDSRVGAHGVMAGVLSVLLKIALLGELDRTAVMAALISAPVMGRWAQVYGATRYAYARSGGGAGSFTEYVGRRELTINSITAAGLSLLLFQWTGLVLSGIVWIGTILFYAFITKKLGGITGDTLGAATEIMEILTMASIVVLTSFSL